MTGFDKPPFQRVLCPSCGKLLSETRSDRPLRAEALQQENDERYEIKTRCPRCRAWIGVYKIPRIVPEHNIPGRSIKQKQA